MSDALDALGTIDDDSSDAPSKPSVWKIGFRVVLVVGALVVSGVVLATTFDDLDIDAVGDALRSLGDAEVLALLSMWLLWLAAQGLQTSSLIRGLAVRRGVVAFLGPTAISSVVPGPSDLPVRLRMLKSWGSTTQEATVAVAAGGLFSIGIKLVLPIVAAAGLLVSNAAIDGALRAVVVVAFVVGLVLALIGVVVGSASRTAAAGRLLDPVWRAVLRLFRRPEGRELADRLVSARAQAMDTLHGRWLIACWGTLLTVTTRFSLLLMALRFMDVSEGDLRWTEVFVIYALVQGLTVLPLTAGDAGVSEVAFIGLLSAAAGSDMVNQVTAAVVVFRVLTWLVLIPVGLATLAGWRIVTRRSVARQAVGEPA